MFRKFVFHKIRNSVIHNFRFSATPVFIGISSRFLAHLNEKHYLCISEDNPTARQVCAKRNSKLYFCADKLRSPPQKSPCQHLRSWGMSPRDSVTL